MLAFIRKLPLLGGLFSVRPDEITGSAAPNRYRVGYAIRNINPWVNNDPAQGFRSGLFIMAGNDGSNPKYTANRLFDDNGDGIVDQNDGLFTTATAITDSFNNTVLYLTIDSVRAYPMVTSAVKEAIVCALGDDIISADRILLSANHTHSGPPFDKLSNGTEDQIAYYNWVIEQIKEAAVEAYSDRAPATMSKGTVNAKEATAALGYNGGKGYHMNAIRHYEVTLTENISCEEKRVNKYLTGSGDVVRSSAESSSKEYRTVEMADNNMHVLLFKFSDDAAKKPVAFVNWRAHCTMNSGAIPDALSSDYVNGLRTTLAKAGYRAAYFQGASGNIIAVAREKVWSVMPETKDWVEYVEDTLTPGQTVNERKTFVYGSMLADIAKYCIETGKMQECSASEIRTLQLTWHGELQKDSAGLQEAAQRTKELEAEKTAFKYPFTYNGHTVNARLHRNAILTRKNASTAFTDLELNTILLGDDVAFVTAPNELVDKYYEYCVGEKYAFHNNSWNDLIDEATYGVPFVLGYTNDHRGYIGNWLDHTANSSTYYEITGYAQDGDKLLGPGTYEAYISRFAQGQGEALIKQFGVMLNYLQTPNATECEVSAKTVE